MHFKYEFFIAARHATCSAQDKCPLGCLLSAGLCLRSCGPFFALVFPLSLPPSLSSFLLFFLFCPTKCLLIPGVNQQERPRRCALGWPADVLAGAQSIERIMQPAASRQQQQQLPLVWAIKRPQFRCLFTLLINCH